jgi:hypothetical protein
VRFSVPNCHFGEKCVLTPVQCGLIVISPIKKFIEINNSRGQLVGVKISHCFLKKKALDHIRNMLVSLFAGHATLNRKEGKKSFKISISGFGPMYYGFGKGATTKVFFCTYQEILQV